MAEKKEIVPPKYDLDAKWDACLDLTVRRFVYSSLAGAFGGLLLFSPFSSLSLSLSFPSLNFPPWLLRKLHLKHKWKLTIDIYFFFVLFLPHHLFFTEDNTFYLQPSSYIGSNFSISVLLLRFRSFGMSDCSAVRFPYWL